ncbi:hypothetical protein RFI_10317 [Reticulomyxa filosa]|uniref:Methyltransferase domain-containing protein n=1 Tax=Reticulomyxa filosa TaxID=46433 RepID=X6NLF3_RETFI|nr:hypothetical protein RFI_10317 [Reticulomyxa filosa]|eukprot:ETO26816.1 hypothetical protein RFI_10317 [Reticulomyxa filosa]
MFIFHGKVNSLHRGATYVCQFFLQYTVQTEMNLKTGGTKHHYCLVKLPFINFVRQTFFLIFSFFARENCSNENNPLNSGFSSGKYLIQTCLRFIMNIWQVLFYAYFVGPITFGVIVWWSLRLKGSRLHFFEIHDQPWCSYWIREWVQSQLAAGWSMLNLPLPKPSMADICANEILSIVRTYQVSEIVDMCSGGGGPCAVIQRSLNQYSKNPVSITMTDLYPNVARWQQICKQAPNLKYIEKSVDAMAMSNSNSAKSPRSPKSERRLRTLFASMHHFDEKEVSNILKDVIQNEDVFIAVEPLGFKVLPQLFQWCLGPVLFNWALLYQSLFALKPFRWQWIVFHPLLIYVAIFDGTISWARLHQPNTFIKTCKTLAAQYKKDYEYKVQEINPYAFLLKTCVVYIAAPKLRSQNFLSQIENFSQQKEQKLVLLAEKKFFLRLKTQGKRQVTILTTSTRSIKKVVCTLTEQKRQCIVFNKYDNTTLPFRLLFVFIFFFFTFASPLSPLKKLADGQLAKELGEIMNRTIDIQKPFLYNPCVDANEFIKELFANTTNVRCKKNKYYCTKYFTPFLRHLFEVSLSRQTHIRIAYTISHMRNFAKNNNNKKNNNNPHPFFFFFFNYIFANQISKRHEFYGVENGFFGKFCTFIQFVITEKKRQNSVERKRLVM